ncbi:MAG: carbamoyltransferase C-terminal domain-containing protein [Myxococcota bacterium]
MLGSLLRRWAQWEGYRPLDSIPQMPVPSGETVWILGVNGGSHDAGAALVQVRAGEARLVLNAEEERWSRTKHECGLPVHSLQAALSLVHSQGGSPEQIVAAACGWDFAAFVETWVGEVGAELPRSLGLLRAQGTVDVPAARGLPRCVRRHIGSHVQGVAVVAHHDAHAWGSWLLSPWGQDEEPTLVLVIDGMGDRGALSVYLAAQGDLALVYQHDSVFDSLGLMYQWLSSTQGGWTPLASEGRLMGAAAWGECDRARNAIYQELRAMLILGDDGSVGLDRQWIQWHLTPRRPYGVPLRKVLGEPISTSKLWDPNAVLDPHNLEVPELTQQRLDRAAAIQLVFEDAVRHVLDHWVRRTGVRRVVWTGGTALNAVAALRIGEACPHLQLWTPPMPGDNGVAAGAALRLGQHMGWITTVQPLRHAFVGGGGLTSTGIEHALLGFHGSVVEIPTSELPERLAGWLYAGAVVGLAQGQAETGPRALGHRSILADPTRDDALERINQHVKRREAVRPLAPMMLAEDAQRFFEIVPMEGHDPWSAWRWMVRCARARPGAAQALPAVVHVDGSSRVQVVDPHVDPLLGATLSHIKAHTGIACLVNTSLNVGAPIAHSAEDVLRTLSRAKDLHGVVIVGDDGRSWLAFLPDRDAGRELAGWVAG